MKFTQKLNIVCRLLWSLSLLFILCIELSENYYAMLPYDIIQKTMCKWAGGEWWVDDFYVNENITIQFFPSSSQNHWIISEILWLSFSFLNYAEVIACNKKTSRIKNSIKSSSALKQFWRDTQNSIDKYFSFYDTLTSKKFVPTKHFLLSCYRSEKHEDD